MILKGEKTTMLRKQNKKGFTLAELLIVVAIIAVLVAIAVPLFVGALSNAQEARDNANIRAVRGAAVVYLLENSTDTTNVWTENAEKFGWKVVAEITNSGDIKSLDVDPEASNTNASTAPTCVASTDTANNKGGFTVTLYLQKTDVSDITNKE